MTRYKLPSDDQQNRLNDFAGDDVTSLRDEIALTKTLIEQNAGNPSVVSTMLVTLTKLIASHDAAAARAGLWIHRQKAAWLFQQLCGHVYTAFGDLPDYAERMDTVITAWGADMERAQKPTQAQIEDMSGVRQK